MSQSSNRGQQVGQLEDLKAPSSSPIDSTDKIAPTESVSAKLAVQASAEIRPTPLVHAIEIPSIEQVEGELSTESMFKLMITEQSEELKQLSHAVKRGELSEDEAERELLLLALTHTLNVPQSIALSALARLQESISHATELREGLRSLWAPIED